jgi:Flp pilus assembly protein TadD
MLAVQAKKADSMPRSTTRLGIPALCALLLCGTALAGTTEPSSSSVSMVQGLDAGIRDAQAKRAQKDYAGAVRVLSQLMLVAPDDARVVGEYGKVLVQQGRSREGLDFLLRATQLQPGDWTYLSALGIAYDQVGDFANARTAYDRALAIRPSDPVILNNFAMSRMLAGDLPQARKLITQAAVGSKNEQIARNVKLIDGLPQPVVAATTPAKTAPVAASTPAKAATVVATTPVKTVPVAVPAAAPTTVAQHPPRQLVPAVAAAPSPTPSHVVMQQIPSDSKAGPVTRTVRAAHAKPVVATTVKPVVTATAPKVTPVASTPKHVAPPVTVVKNTVKPATNGGIPALRLANDRP